MSTLKNLFFLLSLISFTAYSQSSANFKKHGASLAYGQNFLLGDFGDLGDDSTALDFYYHYKTSYTFQWLVNFHINSFEKNSQKVELMSLNTSIKAKLFDFDSFAPYALGGLGFYFPSATRSLSAGFADTGTETVFGLNFGAGVDLSLNPNMAAGFVAHYHHPFSKDVEGQPELSGSYLKIMLQATYYFL